MNLSYSSIIEGQEATGQNNSNPNPNNNPNNNSNPNPNNNATNSNNIETMFPTDKPVPDFCRNTWNASLILLTDNETCEDKINGSNASCTNYIYELEDLKDPL